MRRREFISLFVSTVVASPLTARAQNSAMPIIGFLQSASHDYLTKMAVTVNQGLKETGYIEGQSVAIEYRWADGHTDRLPALAATLVRRGVAVMLAAGGPEPARAAMAATKTIPIVFVSATDPVQIGLVASLNRPGGNVTGINMIGSSLGAKRLELLHQLAPKVSTIAALIDPNYPAAKIQSQEAQEAANQLGLKLITLSASTESDIETAFANLAQQGAGALIVAQGPLFITQGGLLATLAARYMIPAMYSQREYIAAGGLMSYGPDFPEGYRQAGIYIGRILKGEKPADLPVVQPTKFDLVINLKTAKALSLTVPPSLLALADEVIE
jgi:putative tryptophan/tyrosine transport system substrate-binding protein